MVPTQVKKISFVAQQFYRASASTPLSEPIVLLHGWGCDSQIWEPLLPGLRQLSNVITIDLPGFGDSEALDNFDVSAILALLVDTLPEKSILMGWSLGGMLAVAFAAKYPHRVTHVITLATNAKFVASEDYPEAMPLVVNQQFNNGFAADGEKTLQLFSGLLVQGDRNERGLLKALRKVPNKRALNSNWQDALLVLATLDNRENFSRLSQPGLHLLAERDSLVPLSAANTLAIFNTKQRIQIIPEAAHAIHWSQPDLVLQKITHFLSPQALDKRKVAQSFSRAAESYDLVARLQRDVGATLLKHMHNHQNLSVNADQLNILDLGCGTGFFSKALRSLWPTANIISLDIASGMLRYAQDQHGCMAHWLCADAERLPLKTGSIDLIFSSLAVQWCDDLTQLFYELHRALKPDGRLLLSTLGPETLHELKAAWRQADQYVHVNYFPPATDVRAALEKNKFATLFWCVDYKVLYYEKLVGLTRELKALGAHNVNRGKPEGLTGRQKIEVLKNAYEHFRVAAGLPATYEVFYLIASPQ